MSINPVSISSTQISYDTPVQIVYPAKPSDSASADNTTKNFVPSLTPIQNTDHNKKTVQSVSDEAVQKAVDKVNKILSGTPMKFEYSVHKNSSDIIIKVVNAETNEVVREIPSDKFLDLMDKLQEISGAIFDEKR